MSHTRIYVASLAILGAAVGAFPQEVPPELPPAYFAGNEALDAYLREALENHPTLKAQFEDWQAALERIPQAGALEDPMLGYTQFLSSDTTWFRAEVEQKFPWFGTREVRREKAAAEAEYGLAQLHEQRNAILRDVKLAYFDYAFLLDRLQIVGEQTGIMEETAEIARAQYDAGWSSQAEVLRMEQELAKMADMKRELEQMEPAARAALNAALGRPRDGALDQPAPVAFPGEPPATEALDLAIGEHSPALRMYDHMIDAGEKEVELARRMKYPDVTLGLEYSRERDMRSEIRDPYAPGRLQVYGDLANVAAGRESLTPSMLLETYDMFVYKEPERDPNDEIMVSVAINLPIWKKRIQAGVAEKEHMLNASRWRKEDELRLLSADAREMRFEWEDASRRLDLYGDDLARREELILEGLRAEYASGNEEASIPAMLDSLRNQMEFRIEYLRALRDKHQAAAYLEFILGGPWK